MNHANKQIVKRKIKVDFLTDNLKEYFKTLFENFWLLVNTLFYYGTHKYKGKDHKGNQVTGQVIRLGALIIRIMEFGADD
jgi:hypothetical protein